MPESRWEMKIGSPVMATDGEYGHLQQVIVDPQQERVVALLVRRQGLLTPHTIVVPEEAIAAATDSEVQLKISLAQMNALPEYKPGTGLVVDGRAYQVHDDAFAVRGSQGIQVGRPPALWQPAMLESQPVQSERERQALRLQAGQKVFCRDGHAGKVSLILLEPSGRVKGFVMHAGHLPGRNLIVPVTSVQEVDRENVHLSIEKSTFERLPDYDSDFVLTQQAYDTLWADEVLRNTDYKEIEVTVEDGMVTLRGHVCTRMNRTRAEAAAHLVPGVLGVKNHLVVDDDLVIAVAQALGHGKRTRLANISVGAQNGVITLSGQVGSAATREAAEELAASLPKVRGVANYLRAPNVVLNPQEGRVLEPPIGGEAIATDVSVGHVERVIIDPHNRRVIAFALHGYFPDPQHASDRGLPDEKPQVERRVAVPIRTVRYETDNSVGLNVSSAEIARRREFDAADFVTPPEDWEPPYPYCWGDVLFKRESENEPEI